jgi:hypothetical protein
MSSYARKGLMKRLIKQQGHGMRKKERWSTPLLLPFNPPRQLWLSGNVRRFLDLGEDNCPRPFESIDLALDFTGRPIQ